MRTEDATRDKLAATTSTRRVVFSATNFATSGPDLHQCWIRHYILSFAHVWAGLLCIQGLTCSPPMRVESGSYSLKVIKSTAFSSQCYTHVFPSSSTFHTPARAKTTTQAFFPSKFITKSSLYLPQQNSSENQKQDNVATTLQYFINICTEMKILHLNDRILMNILRKTLRSNITIIFTIQSEESFRFFLYCSKRHERRTRSITTIVQEKIHIAKKLMNANNYLRHEDLTKFVEPWRSIALMTNAKLLITLVRDLPSNLLDCWWRTFRCVLNQPFSD